MGYFENLDSPETIKAVYRSLCMKNHPDRGGSTSIMQDINVAYQAALKAVHGHVSKGTDGKDHTYSYDQAVETEIMNKVADIIHTGMTNVEIMLIGSWIWVKGDTKPYSKLLGKKGLGMFWHRKRSAWYWHLPTKRRSRYNSKADLAGLAASYGYRSFDSDERKQVKG